MSSLDSSGGVITGEFAKWTAEQQKNRAFTLRQQRLYAEEEGRQGKKVKQAHDNNYKPKK